MSISKNAKTGPGVTVRPGTTIGPEVEIHGTAPIKAGTRVPGHTKHEQMADGSPPKSLLASENEREANAKTAPSPYQAPGGSQKPQAVVRGANRPVGDRAPQPGPATERAQPAM